MENLKLKKNQQIGRKSNSKRFGNCWRKEITNLPFETPIPVGTRSRKSRKNDIKD
nr:hypothetical protein [Mycoplasmopsis bovis]